MQNIAQYKITEEKEANIMEILLVNEDPFHVGEVFPFRNAKWRVTSKTIVGKPMEENHQIVELVTYNCVQSILS